MSTTSSDTPKTLMEAVAFFSQPDTAHNFMVALRWADGVKCPRCDSCNVCAISTRKTWECKDCTTQKQFSVKTGTIFEESPLPLAKWLATIWLISNAKNGISSYEVHRAIGVTQKTAWFMLHRVRHVMQTGTFEKLKGNVEADETFIGGKSKNMHAARRKRGIKGTGWAGKSIVMGLIERGGTVIAKHVHSNSTAVVQAEIKANVEPGSTVHTDALKSYNKMPEEFVHEMIDHAVAYVNGTVHTNCMENFWSCLKRTLKGTYISVDPAHLFRYLDEQVCRFNNRKTDDAGRFLLVIRSIIGRRLTYSQLTGKTSLI